MLFLKPKDVAKTLNTSPTRISAFATDIEQARVYSFSKTALGSFLFQEKDIVVLKEYGDLMRFFNRKKEALEMLSQQVKVMPVDQDKRPEWAKYLRNAKFLF